MFHVLTETLNEEMTPCSRVLPLFDVASLEVKAQEAWLAMLITCINQSMIVWKAVENGCFISKKILTRGI